MGLEHGDHLADRRLDRVKALVGRIEALFDEVFEPCQTLEREVDRGLRHANHSLAADARFGVAMSGRVSCPLLTDTPQKTAVPRKKATFRGQGGLRALAMSAASVCERELLGLLNAGDELVSFFSRSLQPFRRHGRYRREG